MKTNLPSNLLTSSPAMAIRSTTPIPFKQQGQAERTLFP